MTFSIITIHKGKFNSLLKTIHSIDSQSKKPNRHLVIAQNLSPKQLKKIKKNYRRFILNKDISIYNAMNIGLEKTPNDYIIFLNSGDQLYDPSVVKYIFKIIKSNNKCIILKTKLIFNNVCFYPKNSFFYSKNYFAHPSFIRPPVIKKKKLYKFNENFQIISDGIWMRNNIIEFGNIKINKYLTKHYIGGISTIPSLILASEKIRVSIFEFIKELIKIILYNLIDKNSFYKLIYKSKFDTK